MRQPFLVGRIDKSTLPSAVRLDRDNLVAQLRHLPGAAVYTLDYHAVSRRWFTQPDAGGAVFTAAMDCLTAETAFQSHRLVVVAHSMGGLITRWAVTSAPGATERARHLGLAVTLGTPHEGSWLAAVGAALLGIAAVPGRPITPDHLQDVVHLLLAGCQAVTDDGCAELRDLLDFLSAALAFIPGSRDLRALPPWPASTRVETLGTRTLLHDVGGMFLLGGSTTLDLGDGVVAVDSATAGDHPEKITACQYTTDAGRAGVDRVLIGLGQKAEIEAPMYHPLVSLVFGTAVTTCGHVSQSRLIQLTTEVLGVVAEQVAEGEPTWAYLSGEHLALVRGQQVRHQVDGAFTGAIFTEDGRYLVAVRRAGARNARVVAIDTWTYERREVPCGGCASAAAAGGAGIAWLDSADQLVRWNANVKSTAAPVAIRLPSTAELREHRRQGRYDTSLSLAAGLGGRLLVSRHYHEATDTTESFVLDPDGTAHDLVDLGIVRLTATASVTADGGPRIAYMRGYQYEVGSGDLDVTVLDPVTRKMRVIDSDTLRVDLFHLGFGPAGEVITPSDLWWGPDGQLYATIGSASYVPWASNVATVRPPSLWRLDGARWTSVDTGPLHAMRQLNRRLKAFVLTDGVLYAELDGKGKRLAAGVTELATPARTDPVDPAAVPRGKPATAPTTPCLATAAFERQASRLGSTIFEGSHVVVRVTGSGVTCYGGWAQAWTTISYPPNRSGRESYVILQYANGRWYWGVDSYWQQLGPPAEMCPTLPGKIRSAMRC